ncbi:10694_t:CDS:2 [Diversispora eburnea]|uniref:10694_t:CDS:1 n=1 Tax=Diversispora eburnea TaxID=1213867 RepID=A0A9N9AEX2_9GLOM|nr:10694_t:CDS:2 [Diversispora eburnea]
MEKFKLQIELIIAENITFGNDNIEEKWNFFRNVTIGKANEIISKKKKLISGKPRISTDSLIRTTNKQVEVLTDLEEIKEEVKNVFSH